MPDARLMTGKPVRMELPNYFWPKGDASRDTRLTQETMIKQFNHSNREELAAGEGGLGAVLRFPVARGLRHAAYANL
jgi:hypothetical protein